MKDGNKTIKQLINEMVELRQRVVTLEKKEAEYKQSEMTIESLRQQSALILNSAGEGIIGLDVNGNHVFVNTAAAKMLGYEFEELIGGHSHTIWHHSRADASPYPEEECPIYAAFTNGTVNHRVRDEVFWRKDGTSFSVGYTSTPILEDGKIVGAVVTFIDITELKHAEEALRESEERYRSLVESTEDSIYLVDRNYKYLFMNKKHLLRMGFSGDEYLGQEYSKFHSPDETKWFIEKANLVFTTGGSIHNEHKSLRDGRYFLQTLSPVKKSDGTVIAVTVVSKDINELKSMEEKFHALSLTDDLTGLYNRRGFFTLADKQLKIVNRQKMGVFMLYIDLNDLKVINDTLGHKEGDVALTDTADILKENFREADIIARIGGDEFVVFPAGFTGDDLMMIIFRLEKAVDLHNSMGNRSYKLSLSTGIAYYDPENPCSIDELLVLGDRAMYEQKKNKYKSYSGNLTFSGGLMRWSA